MSKPVLVNDNGFMLALLDVRPSQSADCGRLRGVQFGQGTVNDCLAELSYCLLKNRCSGHKGQVQFLHWIKSNSATVCSSTCEDCSSLEQTLAHFKNEAMGLTEAMLLVLVKRFSDNSITSVDQRHMSIFRSL